MASRGRRNSLSEGLKLSVDTDPSISPRPRSMSVVGTSPPVLTKQASSLRSEDAEYMDSIKRRVSATKLGGEAFNAAAASVAEERRRVAEAAAAMMLSRRCD